MFVEVKPGVLNGMVIAPSSKSHTHRALILGLLADGCTKIQAPLISEHTQSTLNALSSFGAKIEENNQGYSIYPENLHSPNNPIDIGNSGTALRLLCGVASLLDGETTFTGDESVMQRPIEPLLQSLNQLGASCKTVENNGRLPVIIKGVINKEYTKLRGDISSQFLSSLLISCPLKHNDTTIELTTELVSPWYVDLTVNMMREFGVEVSVNHEVKGKKTLQKFQINGIQKYKAVDYQIPGDFSSAAFLLVGAAITGGQVKVQNLDQNSCQGDKAILDILRSAGANVQINDDYVEVSDGEITGFEVDCSNIPDLFPILAVLGAYAKGKTRLFRAGHVKYKESNRITTTATMLKAIGVDIKISDEGIIIHGGKPIENGVINPMGDHRIFMAGLIAGLGAKEPIKILGANCYKNSYPNFINDVRALGASVEIKP